MTKLGECLGLGNFPGCLGSFGCDFQATDVALQQLRGRSVPQQGPWKWRVERASSKRESRRYKGKRSLISFIYGCSASLVSFEPARLAMEFTI